jgi:hypothetical protein
MPQSQHGALSANTLFTITANKRWNREQVPLPVSPNDVLALAHDHHLTHLWVLPDAGINPTDAWASGLDTAQWNAFVTTDEDVFERHVSSITGYRVSEKYMPRLSIIFPAWTHWDWTSVGAQELLIAIRYLEQELGVEVSGSPGMTGVRGIKQSMQTLHPEAIAPLPVDVRAMGWTNEVVEDIYWCRRPTDNELARKYLHKLDKNSAYLRGCQETFQGVGTPQLMDGDSFDGKRPGLWDIAIGHSRQLYAPELMQYFPPMVPEEADMTRVPTPIVKLINRTNEVIVKGGLAWEVSYRTLKPWADDLWVSRMKFRKPHPDYPHERGRALAYGGIKQIAVQTIGLLGSPRMEFNPNRLKAEYRPDWRINVISENRAQMFYNMFKIFAHTTLTPVLVYTDALYYLSDEQDATVLFGDMIAPDKLGGLKSEWVVPMNDILRELFMVPRDEMSEAEKLHIINTYQREVCLAY